MKYPIEIKGKTTKQVTKLNLSGLGLKEFPENLFEYTNLTKLVLSNNRIKVIPKEILRLRKLKVLDLANNDICVLHSSVFRLPKLKTLNLYGNRIKKFPLQLSESNIRTLIAGKNQIEEFDIGSLKLLEEIDLTNNLLKKLVIPESISNLKVLRIKDNPLETKIVPADLSKNLKFCDVDLYEKLYDDKNNSSKNIPETKDLDQDSNHMKSEKNDNMEINSNKVFIVHGHNELMKQHVARTVIELGLKPIILHEQPNGGKTIIEKFLSNAEEIGFAIVLLSADDLGISKQDKDKYEKEGKTLEKSLADRARQNVVFEMGCFIGLIGRSRVFLLLEEGVEKPGDLDGIVYISYDRNAAWRLELVKEMKNCGYHVSADSLL